MKKQIGLFAIIALLVSFIFFTSPYCAACQQAHPIVQSAAAKYGVALVTYDVSTDVGKGLATANGVSMTPTIIVSGAQSARFEGSVTQVQMEAAIKAAIGNPTPKPTATPKPVVKAVATTKAVATVKAVAVKTDTKTVVQTSKQPTIEVATAAQTPTTSTQTVPEFSLLGLGAPALVIGAIYLFLRRR
jgi:thiol-disulfide isomerase/thioredoxin